VVHLCLLADQVGETASYTRHLGQGIHYLDATIDVGVQNTQDVLEVGAYYQVRLWKPKMMQVIQKPAIRNEWCSIEMVNTAN
jgi:hypothetical protein